MADSLERLVADELTRPVDPAVSEMAAAIADRYGHAARAVLFYGSCLRAADLGRSRDQMLDFYLLVSSYREAYGRGWLAVANRLIPPNVFPFSHRDLAAKYAVLSEADFRRACSPAAPTVSVWARFAQPSRLVWTRDEHARGHVRQSVAAATRTFLGLARPAVPVEDRADILAVWRRGLALTYGCELRAERQDRSGAIVDADPGRYRAFGLAAMPTATSIVSSNEANLRLWRGLKWRGKLISVARLLKASTTFAGGIDYLVWKINRHSGTTVTLAPWQRRWPVLGAITLLPRLLKAGAIR